MATILVIDDNAGVRDLVQDALEVLGHAVVPFTNGISAMSWLQAPGNVPDMALIDWNLPGMSGAETAESLQRYAPGVLLLFMSGEPDVRHRVTNLLPKPFGLSDLEEAVNRVLGHEASPGAVTGEATSDLPMAVRAERVRILRVLHDDISQRLTGMRLVTDLVAAGVLDPGTAMDRITPELGAAVESLRRLMDELSGMG